MHKKIIFGILVFFIIFAIGFWIIPGIIIKNNSKTIIENYNVDGIDKIYNITDLYKMSKNKITVELKIKNQIIYSNMCEIDINIIDFDSQEYDINLYIDDINLSKEDVQRVQKNKYIKLDEEGNHQIKVQINVEDNIIAEDTKKIYYIKPYDKQFLDEFSNKGTIVHYLNGSWEKYEKTADLLINCGIKNIRTTFSWKDIEINNEKDIFNFDYYDKWIDKLTQNEVNIIACFNRISQYSGEDKIINNEKEKAEFLKFAKEVIGRYPQIKNYEFINEPNLNSQYITNEDVNWYASVLKELSEIEGINIITGGTNTPDEDSLDGTKSSTFFKQLFNNGVYKHCNNYAYHPYDSYMNNIQNNRLYMKLNEHKNIFQDEGGFINQYVTEYGIHITDLQTQANKILQQTVILDKYNIKYSMQYNFWNTGENLGNVQNNYGLINYDYTPKPAYYAMKNFLTNTNGAEYIGNLDLAEELEAHVYDKDGKPVIIAWSNNSSKNIEINYKNFTAKDIYGKEIKANENGKLVITTSPVYIYNLDYKYYYKAISKVATEKYQEFEEKFAEQISKMPNVQNKITQMKTYMQNVGKAESKILETSSIKAMKMHYEIGNAILEAYNNKQIEVEPVKISSMLDALDDIGNSYEDLVTVTAQTREPKLEQTKLKIKNAEEKINKNSEIEIIYPNKILEFSKDYYEKAEYINNLEEENDIKTGLIMSKILHSELLANWSDIFSQIQIDKYIDQYISDNPITINYSTTEITNKNVTATLETTAKIEITNNSNSKKYTFEENGSFTYEYKIKGRALKITATVNNIDKESPKILGVTDGKVYTEPVTPQITDKNLQEIKLTFNGEIIEEYESNIKLQDEGYYVITAKDKAGNETKTEFQILTNQNKDYQIQGTTINNISASTNKKDFEEKLGIETQYTVTRNGKEIKENEAIATGDVLTTKSGDNYTLIVTGDVNRDGKITIHDIIKLRIHLVYENNLDKIEQIAADCNLDGKKLGISDLIRMRIIATMQIDSK